MNTEQGSAPVGVCKKQVLQHRLRDDERKAAETVRPRTLLLFALVVLLGALATVSPALANASEVKLEVNQNCVDPNWPCWATPGSGSPALTVKIAAGDEVMFTDHDASTAAAVVWMGSAPACAGVPTSAMTNWEGKCKFATSGTYKFESSTLFKQAQSAYGNNIDYTKYEIVVAGTPTDATTSASGETQTEAMLNGGIGPEGNAVEYHFEYEGPGVTGKQSTPTAMLSAADFTSHSVSAPVTGLQPGMTYHFLLVATYGGKTVAGATTQTFTTHAVTVPTATTLAAEGFKETGATLKGTVNPGGETTEYFFEYGTDTHYGQKTEKATLSASGGNQGVSATLKGLTLGTEYHFRLVAKNKQGPGEGLDRSFKTMSPAAKEEPTKEPPAKEPTPSPTPTPTPGPISPEPELAPLGSALVEGSLKLTAPRHGSSVSGSLVVSKSGAGGRLEIDLIANSASLAKVRHKKSTSTAVGRLVRSSVSAGNVSFSISLNARAKGALRRHHKLALTVKITLTPPTGAPAVVTRNVVLHA
jgi:hypothetical protein